MKASNRGGFFLIVLCPDVNRALLHQAVTRNNVRLGTTKLR